MLLNVNIHWMFRAGRTGSARGLESYSILIYSILIRHNATSCDLAACTAHEHVCRYSHLSNHKILEDDNIFLHQQEQTLRHPPRQRQPEGEAGGPQLAAAARDGAEEEGREGRCSGSGGGELAYDWRRRFYMPSRADVLVASYRSWLDRYSRG